MTPHRLVCRVCGPTKGVLPNRVRYELRRHTPQDGSHTGVATYWLCARCEAALESVFGELEKALPLEAAS